MQWPSVLWTIGAGAIATLSLACDATPNVDSETSSTSIAKHDVKAAQIGQDQQQRIVFTATVDDKRNLYLINVDGTGLRQLTTSPAEDHNPLWSPDGETIVFTRIPGHVPGERRSDGNLWTIQPDGTGLSQLTFGPFFDSDVSWLPGGKAFKFYRQSDEPGVFEINLDGTGLKRRAGADYSIESFSPDGIWIAEIRFNSDNEHGTPMRLWLTDAKGDRERRLTSLEGVLFTPVWSPSSDTILLLVEGLEGMQLCSVTIPDGALIVLQSGPRSYYEYATWSPDGTRIAFLESKYEDSMTNASFRQLYVMDADSRNKRRLTNHWGDDYTPQWTRDGKAIIVQSRRGMSRVPSGGVRGWSKSYIVVVDAAGKGEQLLQLPFEAYGLHLSP